MITKLVLTVFLSTLCLFLTHAAERTKYPETYSIFKAHQFSNGKEVLTGFLPFSRLNTIGIIAMHNAINLIEPQYATLHAPKPYNVPRNVDRDAAVYAAHYSAFNYALDTTLTAYGTGKFFVGTQLTDYKSALNTFYTTNMADIPDGAGKNNGIALGIACTNAVIAARANDGWNATLSQPVPFSAGAWNIKEGYPTPAADVIDLIYPQWGSVRTWVIPELDALRPEAPPALDSKEFLDSVAQVKLMGKVDSKVRSPQQTRIADFWASDSARGFGGKVFLALLAQGEHSFHETGRALAIQYLADAEQSIANNHYKTRFNAWRPVMAIRNGATGDSALTGLEKLKDITWTPLKPTPANPEYPAGHPMGTSTATSVGRKVFGWDKFPACVDITGTPNLPGVPTPTVSFCSFTELEQSVSAGRVYGGMHFPFSCKTGIEVGNRFGNYVADKALLPLNM